MSKLNPTTKHLEFNGVTGAIAITLGLPILITFFALILNENYVIAGSYIELDKILQQLPSSIEQLIELCFDLKCWVAYLGWFTVLAVLDVILPGNIIKGTTLRDGTALVYKINGLSMSGLLISILTSRFYITNGELPELEFIYSNQLKLTLTTIIFSFALATLCYLGSFIPLSKANGVGTKERILAEGGNTGNVIYDWFIGRELNSRIGSFDIKLFCELRPGLFLWLLINLSCLHHQYRTYNKISDSLILVNLLQGFYIFDGVLNEEGLLTMIDIVTDGFGFMLCFGDLAWLPWSYSVQSRYLALRPVDLGLVNFSLILILNFIGFYIFRLSNKQKSDFRSGKLDHLNLNSIQTNTGSKLLVDGWWKSSQHINYFGDWIIAWAWCLPTGFNTGLTYFYVIYFGTLLLHRQTRDEAKCRAKYGKYWEEYEKQVPYKIIPYVY